MMKKLHLRTIALSLMAIVIVSFIALVVIVQAEGKKINELKNEMGRNYLLSDAEVAKRHITYDPDNVVFEANLNLADFISMNGIEYKDGGVFVPIDTSIDITLSVPDSGEYQILAEYTSTESNLFENPISVVINGEETICSLPFLWADDINEIETDRYGNEVIPDQKQLKEPSLAFLEDYEHFQRTPIHFNLETGKNVITFTPQNQDMLFYSIRVIRPTEDISYAEYQEEHDEEFKGEKEYEEAIIIEGEDYRAKSDSFIRGKNVKNTSVYPNNPYVKLINATDDKSNKTMGQKVIYEVEVPQDGIYYITFKYSQPLKTGACVYRTIEVDGKVPFTEFRDVGFVYTGIDKYDNFTLGKKEPMGIYLTKGIHTISMKVTAGDMDRLYRELLEIVEEINDTGIQMKKIKGSNSDDTAKVDTNRTWDILQYMPNILNDLNDWNERLTAIYNELKDIGGMNPAFASDILLAAQNLEHLASIPREIPNRMSLLSDDSSSASQLVSLTLTKIYEQNLSIDRFYLHSKDYKLPSPTANLMNELISNTKQFIYSFSDIMNESVAIDNSKDALTIWINKPAQYVEVLRELTAQEFSTKYNIDVVFSIMPDEKKITLANSTGSNPDIALGLSYYRPAEFAMRGMAKNLLEYDDFLDWYSEEYNMESLAPMAYEDGVYGASEQQEFYVLFYRSDILDMLGLEVPDTWDDVKEMMPSLHRSAMNFNLPLANTVGYKSFETTGGFIFQNGGNYYSEDGFSSNFRDPNTLKGLREMIDLYQIYGLAQNIPNFFNAFRSGSVPIGVSNFSTYLQLQVGAPELTGRWDIALVPGTPQEDGSISRYWSANASSAMIFSNTEMPDEAYEFLRWWLSGETQITYATNLQMKYGPDYIWNTANHKAIARMSYPKKHMDIILEQWAWQKETLRHPASYILEREVSNAWIDIVTKGANFQPRIDEASVNSNREMKRKMTEFGYFDENGNRIKEYNVKLIEELKEIIKQKEGGGSEK